MQQLSSFQVYNASAGSGKTFTLVKEYLKIVLQSEDVFRFQKILAITFTNKAAAEMKERVLESLHDFSEGKENDLFLLIINEIPVDAVAIKERSKKILNAVLQNYSAFSITTIDSFTHKIIRNFSFDLGLSLNFEVEMDAISLLNEAVDVLISKIGIDKEVTKLLIDFSLEKIDADTSWDISRELNEFSRILLNEDDTKHFRKLSDKSIEDFRGLKSKLLKSQKEIENNFIHIATKVFDILAVNQLEFSDFSHSDYPKHFVKLKNIAYTKVGDIKFDGRLQKSFEEGKKLYAVKTNSTSKTIIDGFEEELKNLYNESKILYDSQYKYYVLNKLALKSIVPLAVLNNINSELTTIKEENNIRLNAEFNQLISDNIKEQPAPFIYERIGQKFMHYFIDEMQDTSVLQWQNLIPLIDNALAQENSNLLLVGDGKQAIYRWRGGKAEQFINLGSQEKEASNPFHIAKNVRDLATNYRSFSEVIEFNNQFFQHCATFLQNEEYKKLFIDGNQQKTTDKKGGFVSISFLEKEENKEDEPLKYPKKVLEIIKGLDSGFSLGDVCVLVRKKKDGVAVANYLSEKGIAIVSSETLLLQNSKKVHFIIDLLQVIQHSNDEEAKFRVLYFLHQHLQITTDKHVFFKELVHTPNSDFFHRLKQYGVAFDSVDFYTLPFYEKIEEIIRSFNLINTSDAYVQFLLDVVLEQQRKGTDVQGFLDFWEQKKEVLSIVAPETNNAVQVMTIHKSKGLEFPIVIFPYDLEMYRQVDPKVWLDDLPTKNYGDFDELLVSYNKDLRVVNERGAEIYQQQQEEIELDSFNLLYVALTRAVEQIYIVTEKKKQKNIKFYSGVFIDYLQEKSLWNDAVLTYSFGDAKKVSDAKAIKSSVEIQTQFISTSWQEHNVFMLASSSKLWDTTQGEAIEFGNLIHEMMAKIVTEKDSKKVVDQYKRQGIIDEESSKKIKNRIDKIVFHPTLKEFFTSNVTIFNEREIVTIDNQVVIPDRLVFDQQNNVTIIDYKTGEASKKHQQQIIRYQQVLQSMGFNVIKLLLIYIGEEIVVEKV